MACAEPPGVLLTAREVTVTQPLQDAETTEEDRACFSCELSHEDEEVEWSLNGTPLYNDSFHEITHEGRRHTLVLKRVRLADAGTVCASSPKVTASARLEVRGETSVGGAPEVSPQAVVAPSSLTRLHLASSEAGGVPEGSGRCVRRGAGHCGPAVRGLGPSGQSGVAQGWRGAGPQRQV